VVVALTVGSVTMIVPVSAWQPATFPALNQRQAVRYEIPGCWASTLNFTP